MLVSSNTTSIGPGDLLDPWEKSLFSDSTNPPVKRSRKNSLRDVSEGRIGAKQNSTHCLDEDDAMEVVDGIPRCTNSDGDIGGPALEEGVVDVSLEL